MRNNGTWIVPAEMLLHTQKRTAYPYTLSCKQAAVPSLARTYVVHLHCVCLQPPAPGSRAYKLQESIIIYCPGIEKRSRREREREREGGREESMGNSLPSTRPLGSPNGIIMLIADSCSISGPVCPSVACVCCCCCSCSYCCIAQRLGVCACVPFCVHVCDYKVCATLSCMNSACCTKSFNPFHPTGPFFAPPPQKI